MVLAKQLHQVQKKGIKCECGSHGSAHEAGTRWFLLVSPHAPPCESGFPGRQIEAMKGAPHLVSKAGGQAGTKAAANAGNIS